MESKPFCWILLSLLILSCFVSQTHEKMQQTRAYLHNSTLKKSSGFDMSFFEAIDNFNETSSVHPQEGLKEKDRIERLPGQTQVNFSQYGGYVTVDKSAGRALYYYLVEAQHSKDSLPLLLWLNGGPGCSSLAYGAMQELGPFRVHSDGKTLYDNKFSWNNAANVLFLESPAGVGFSYSNTTLDYSMNGDRRTAGDNYVFLLNWLRRFPEYKNRDFYVAGESYAGHYVPQLAHTILFHNKKANKTIINLKGIITHAIVSDRDVYQIQKYCNFSSNASTPSRDCIAAREAALEEISYINIYNIYAPLCSSSNLTARPKKTSIFRFDPCSEYYVYAYMNRPDVQEALHANVTRLTHDWEPCSDVIHKWVDSQSTIIPHLQELMAHGLRVWIFSGDIDGRVPITSTKYSINKMKLPIKTTWHPWFLTKDQVGGYTQVYEGDLTFATVREAGHEVPSYQPARAFSLIKHFLEGKPLPDSSRHN
ncbi:serine carboxypeptidase-like 40 [Quercus suber]|uniref:Carboxypeptidase n=1 Tax=Quercus suber TaxID=58331 RepID=A0AAW0LNJ5_QUESU